MRIRSIKPDFHQDEDLAEHSPFVRLLFIGLWGLADGKGRLKYRPRFIKTKVLPYDDVDIVQMLDDLDRTGFIQIYEADGQKLIQVRTFRKHQRISGKEAEEDSEFPAPPPWKARRSPSVGSNGEATGKQSGSNGEAAIVLERKGREGKGKEGKGETGAKDAPELVPVPSSTPVEGKPTTAQAFFVERFKASYEAMTKQPFKVEKHDYVIAANLIRDHGPDEVVRKAKTLGVLCRDRSAWFTEKAGWGAYTIKTLSAKWNEILPTENLDPGAKRDKEFLDEMKRQEALSAIAEGRSH